MGIFNQKAKSGGDSSPPPAGNHPAVCVAVIDLGTHDKDFKGKKYKQRDLLIAWELTAEKCPGTTRNHIMIRQFSLSLGSKAALRAFLSGWRGKPLKDDESVDIDKLLGVKCLLNVTHKEGNEGAVYAKAESATPVPKGMTVPVAEQKPFVFELGNGAYPEPAWIPYLYGKPVKQVIAESDEMRGDSSRPLADEGEIGGDEQAGEPPF